jgi:hypothetical protein
MHAYDTNIKLLKELEMISSYTYKNTFTSKMIESLEEISLSKSLIQELKELIYILNNVNLDESEENGKPIPKSYKPLDNNTQRFLTDKYVKQFKNDATETIASTVIENVYNYLNHYKPFNEQINKNQIGYDLVDLGVKKIRKSKGFVYGIEDTKQNRQL